MVGFVFDAVDICDGLAGFCPALCVQFLLLRNRPYSAGYRKFYRATCNGCPDYPGQVRVNADQVFVRWAYF